MKKILLIISLFVSAVVSGQAISTLPIRSSKCDSCLVATVVKVGNAYVANRMYMIDVTKSATSSGGTLDSNQIKARIRDSIAAHPLSVSLWYNESQFVHGGDDVTRPLEIFPSLLGTSLKRLANPPSTDSLYFNTLTHKLGIVNPAKTFWLYYSASDSAAVNAPPVASSVTLTGPDTVGKVKTGTSNYTDAEGDLQAGTVIKFFTSPTIGGTKTLVYTGSSYTVQKADTGKYIYRSVTPGAATGTTPGLEVFSSPSGVIKDSAATPGGVTFSDNFVTSGNLSGYNNWSQSEGSTDATIANNTVSFYPPSGAWVNNTASISNVADGTISAVIKIPTASNSGAQNGVAFIFRTNYLIDFYIDGPSYGIMKFQLYKKVSGTYTAVGSEMQTSFGTAYYDTDMNISFSFTGSTYSITVNGDVTSIPSDATYLTGGVTGFRAGHSGSDLKTLKSYTVTKVN